ncbi:RusA family crossover junction endodeoxyribonuclease [Microcoleus sp. F10-A1]|uniref:RusA family crossover junction endodeoxyribonuclease n=1 Tax=Microcoleus sp. F10-A1 TaxID=2818750 RepID=UPI002FD03B55
MDTSAKFKTYVQHPEIDILFGHVGATIPSKRQDFKPIQMTAVYEDGTEEILHNFYVRKPSTKSVQEFEQLIRDQITSSSLQEKKIMKPSLVEVTIAISLTREKYFDIDVDNISKTVLDAIKGYLIEDDSQVKRLICDKDIHPLNKDGFFIALTELTPKRRGLMGDFYLFSEQK